MFEPLLPTWVFDTQGSFSSLAMRELYEKLESKEGLMEGIRMARDYYMWEITKNNCALYISVGSRWFLIKIFEQ